MRSVNTGQSPRFAPAGSINSPRGGIVRGDPCRYLCRRALQPVITLASPDASSPQWHHSHALSEFIPRIPWEDDRQAVQMEILKGNAHRWRQPGRILEFHFDATARSPLEKQEVQFCARMRSPEIGRVRMNQF